MRAEVRRVLDVVEDALLKRDDAAEDLWCILSALRGPDGTKRRGLNSAVKPCKAHTVAIRRAAFPRIAEEDDSGKAIGVAGRADMRGYQTVNLHEASMRFRSLHFERHIRQAAQACLQEDDLDA